MQGQVVGALTWSVAAHWVHWPWGFLGSAGQGQPPPVFCLAIGAVLGDSQVKPTFESRVAAASAALELTEASYCLFERT